MCKTIIYKFDALIELSENLQLTKRNLLKIVAKFFNPLGMLSPLTIGMRVNTSGMNAYQKPFRKDGGSG